MNYLDSSSDGVKKAATKGVLISGAVTFLMRVINFVSALFLLRILDPSDFGVVALAMLLVGAASLFADLGMGPAVVYSKANRNTIAFHGFVTSMCFSATLSLLIYGNSGLLVSLLAAPEIQPVIEWMSLYLVLSTASTIPFCLLRKELLFKQIGYVTFFSEVMITAVQLTLAFLGFGLWSLVVGRIVGAATRLIISWWLCPGWDWLRPVKWDRKVHADLLRFGVQSTGTGVVSYAYSHFDDWLVGRSLGTVALGFYSKAYDLTHTTTNRISRNIIRVVFFPVYVKIRDNKQRLSRAYLKNLGFILIFMTPLAFGMLVLASDMVRIIFGEKWLPMAPVMQVYSLVLLTRPVSENSAPLFQSFGKPKYNMYAGLLVLLIIVPLSLLFVSGGIVGVAIAVAIAHFFGMIFNLYQVNKLLPGTVGSSLLLMLLTLCSGAIMALTVIAARHYILGSTGAVLGVWGLILLIMVGAVSYVISTFLLQRAFVLEILELLTSALKEKIRKIRQKN